MVQHPVVMRIVGAFLGERVHHGLGGREPDACPGGPGQEPHIDYPYWDHLQARPRSPPEHQLERSR